MADINIYGVLHNNTPDGIIARTEQIADNDGVKLSEQISKLGDIDNLTLEVSTINNTLDTKLVESNFKTINGNSVFGPGEITITSEGQLTVDGELNPDSLNPVQNKVITLELQKYPSTRIEESNIDDIFTE